MLAWLIGHKYKDLAEKAAAMNRIQLLGQEENV